MSIGTLEKKQNAGLESLENKIEWEACEMSAEYFLSKYCLIKDSALMETVHWQPWPYLLNLLRTFELHKEVIILKARQLGITWLVCGYCTWMALFHKNVKILFFSQGEEEAWDLISKCRFIYNNLPPFLRMSVDHDMRSVMTFPTTGSELKALASTKDAGRSTDATIVVQDELEKHPYAAENFLAVGPTVDAGGRLIQLSTINKLVATSHFQERYKEAKAKINNAFPVFLGWKNRPNRDASMTLDDWYNDKIKKKYKQWEIEQEYPETEKEALSPFSACAYFDTDTLMSMLLDVRNPLQGVEGINTYGNMVRIYKLPAIGRRYAVMTDPSDGIEDPHATIVCDAATMEEVACSSGLTSAEANARIHDMLVRFYNNAYNSFENNARAGGRFGEIIKQLNTPNQAPTRNISGKIKVDKSGNTTNFGQYTTPQLKDTILLGLKDAVKNRLITPHTKDAVLQFREMIQPSGDDPQVPKGQHDDYIMAWAHLVNLVKYMPLTSGSVKSFYPSTRR